MPVIPFLEQPRRAQLELTEPALAILAARHERAVVEALVILHRHQQAAPARFGRDIDRLAMDQHQRLHAADVLVMPQRFPNHLAVQLVRHGRHHQAARRQAPDRFAERHCAGYSFL